ncbi:MAG: hypothetical protein WBH90_09275, partial [Aggregatilineales bacterium]
FPQRAAGPAPRHAERRERSPLPPPVEASKPADSALESPTRAREAFCLAALIQRPRLIYRVNRVLAEYLAPEKLANVAPEVVPSGENQPAQAGLAWYITENDFGQPEHRQIFAMWQAALNQDEADPVVWFRENLRDPVTREIVQQWERLSLDALLRKVTPPSAELSDEAIFEEVLRAVLMLRMKQLNDQIQELQFLIQEAEGGGDAQTADKYGAIIKSLLMGHQRLWEAFKRYGTPKGRAEARNSDSHGNRLKVQTA